MTPKQSWPNPELERIGPLAGVLFTSSHGFNVNDGGEGTTDQATGPLRKMGARVIELDRGWEGLITAAWTLNGAARKLRDTVSFQLDKRRWRRIVLLGHSHGCNVIRQALHTYPLLSELVTHAVLINPAVRVDAKFPDAVRVICYHSQHDTTVSASKALRLLPWRWFWPHPWGEGGRKGIRGAKNVDLEQLTGQRIEHSTVFQHDHLVELLVQSIAAHIALPLRPVPPEGQQ